MSPELVLTFIAACVLLALTPGPNMALIVANTLSGGLRGGLVTLAGTTTGLAFLVAAASTGMSAVMVFMASWFDVIRWIGAVYLFYLGAVQLWRLARDPGTSVPPSSAASWRGGKYLQGFFVSLSNPKVILFLGAFLPQFVDFRVDPVGQLTVLALLFVVVLAGVDVITTVAVDRARSALGAARLRLMEGVAGGFLLLGGLALAVMRRP
jgi:threonine/homoserine/homoserine lactone efflux protein